jgi:heme exporter protein C
LMAAATHIWFFASVFARARVSLIELEAGKDWAHDVAMGSGGRHG